MVFLMSWDKDKDFGTELPSNREIYSPGMFRWWGTGGYSRLLILLFHPTEWGTAEVTKCQTKPFLVAFPAPKIRLGGFFCILRRFAKCRLSPVPSFLFPSGCSSGRDVSFCLFISVSICSFNSFRNVDCLVLPESETRNFFLSFSKDLTSADETIVFGRWNYIVWRLKLYCLARETILFRARFVYIPKMKCIVF